MKIQKRIEKAGKVVHVAEFDTDSGMTIAEFAKVAYEDFAKKHPEIDLMDDDVWAKWDKPE